MSSANATFLCLCGAYHPIGSLCDKASNEKGAGTPKAKHEDKAKHEGKACACCCGHGHAHDEMRPPAEVDPALIGKASASTAIYRIMNMDCPVEETLIRKKLASLPGITGLDFNLMQRVLTVRHELPSTQGIEAALNAIDMKPEALGRSQDQGPGQDQGQDQSLGLAQNPALPDLPETRLPWRRLAVAGGFALASEVLELLHDWQVVGGSALLEPLSLLFALAAILLGGLATYRKGWIAVSNLNLNINALMSVAVTGAVLIGQYPEAAMVMVLFNLSEALEAKSLDRARNAVKELLALAPEKATVLGSDGVWEEREISQVAVGSRVRVRPGERVAMDGLLVQGRSAVNQAPITGESLPVEKTVGDTVYAGTINESGSFDFEVTAAASKSTLARIIHAVEEAQGSRAPIQRFVDSFAKWYTPAVFLAALLTALIPPLFMAGAWTQWLYTALVILVIGCPCALVISTPVTLVSGMAAATRHGILIKGGLFLEQGRRLRWLALDKTGTLTHGKPKLTDAMALSPSTESPSLENPSGANLSGSSPEQAELLRLAASLAACSDHPVSRALAAGAAERYLAASGTITLPNDYALDVADFTALPGRGVRGRIQGKTWHLGNHRLVEELGCCSAGLEEKIFRLEKEGKSVVTLVGETGARGIFAVADTLKESSIEALRDLKKLGVKTMMLTGDNEHTARAIAQEVGVDGYEGNLLPQDKLAAVERLRKEGRVGMVGDGINDAPALAGADIGFAMAAAGTDTAIETADVALMDDDLRKLPRFIRLSRGSHAILVQNISLALGVKALFLALTFAGQATMWMAVFADVGTSLLVVANGLRAMRQ